MTVEQLRTHILRQIAELEVRSQRVRATPHTELGDAAAEGRIVGELAAYQDVLGRLPGATPATS